jgi:predicted metal-dependent hydrolase
MRRLRRDPPADWLLVGTQKVRLRLVANRRARRYVLRLSRDGSARVTIPRGGKAGEARKFAEKNLNWLEKQLARRAAERASPKAWTVGTEILFRGEKINVEELIVQRSTFNVQHSERADQDVWHERAAAGAMAFGCGHGVVASALAEKDLRPQVEQHLRRLAEGELTGRVRELAALHQIEVRRVSVRNQRSRWGSCSRRGTISLNWRLVQAPVFVRDYIILHELAHVKEMNHSPRFWREVERLCPGFREAEKWLKANGELLR